MYCIIILSKIKHVKVFITLTVVDVIVIVNLK